MLMDQAVMHYARALAIAKGLLGENRPSLVRIMKPFLVALNKFNKETDVRDMIKEVQSDLARFKETAEK